jgi:hypothetical protein
MTGLEPAQAIAHYPLKVLGGFLYLLGFNVLARFIKINCARFA